MGWSNLREEIEDIFSILDVPDTYGYPTTRAREECSRATAVCARCDKEFSGEGLDPRCKYCEICRKMSNPLKKHVPHPKKCVICGTKLPKPPKGARVVRYVCGRKCRDIRYKRSKK